MEPYETYAYAESGSMAPSGASIDSARLLMLLSKHPPDAIFAIEEDPPPKKKIEWQDPLGKVDMSLFELLCG